jgi:glycosyltransferase involved in cell wall biosynthesis
MSTIVHACSSILIRPNGIVRYINACIDYQKSLGHTVLFVTDSKPSQNIHADKVFYVSETSNYVPKMRDGHVWLQVDTSIIAQIIETFQWCKTHVDHVIAHDLHSYLALEEKAVGTFIQHESDVLNQTTRQSFLSDEYLNRQIDVIGKTNWLVGLTSRKNSVKARRKLFTPIPFFPEISKAADKPKKLLYIGDATERKGAKEFMEVARSIQNEIGAVPVVITHDVDEKLFEGAEIHTFSLDDKDKMFDLMKTCRAAYLPSRNETLCLAALECLQFMPVVVNWEYEWTAAVEEMGVLRIPAQHRTNFIKALLMESTGVNPRRQMLDDWCKIGHSVWETLSA